MAVITITAASVVPGGNQIEELSAGEVIAAGDIIADVDGVAYKADADHATAARAIVLGMALNSGLAVGQPVFVQKVGPVTVGDVLEKGMWYFLSDTAGKMCLLSDLNGGDRANVVGYASSRSELTLAPKSSQVTVAARVDIATTVAGNGTDTNEEQSITIKYATGGTFTLTFEGQTTSNIAYNANAAAIETALEALSNLTAVSVTGSGTVADPFLVTFEDDFSNQDQMTVDITNLLPT